MPRKRSRVFKRPESPFWYAVWTDHQGRVHKQSTGCRDHGAAAAWLATRELERVREGAGIPVARPISLIEAAGAYLDERRPVWSDGWHTAVDGFFANRAIPHFGEGRVVSSVTRADVERFRSQEIGRPVRGGKPASNGTVNRMMAAFAAFGEWCMVDGRHYHTANPWADHEPLPEDEVPVPDLEEEQLDRILAALEGPTGPLPSHGARRFRAPWRLIVEFARETGLRRAELGKIARLDIRQDTLWIVSTRARGRNKGRKMRALPLSPRALEIVRALPRRADGLVFGRIPDPRRAFRTAAKAAGLERVWLHLFRHLFASRLAERGAGRAELREAGGWSSGRMADRYTHARMERLRALISGTTRHPKPTGAPPVEKESGGPETQEPPDSV